MSAPSSPTAEEGKLGQHILARAPQDYRPTTLPTGWENQIEWDEQSLLWNFRGVERRVAMAIRIPVTITYEGQTYRDWLLIGYEGGSGE